jgi:cytochrome c556
MKRLVKIGLIAMCSAAAMPVLAQEAAAPPTPEQLAQQAVELRQGLQKVMGFQMAPLGAMLKNKMPFDAAVAAKNTANLASLASMQPDVFATDTRKFTLKTKAREGIWTNKSDFDAKSNDLVKAANDATAAAKTGDKAATLKAVAGVGKACGACHDNFREK